MIVKQHLVFFDTMFTPRSCLLTWVLIICNSVGPDYCMASQKKTLCHVQDGRADCSHLSLSAIPPDLPRNITSLDISHNRLGRLLPETLNLYAGLLDLNINYNSITNLNEGVCKSLPLLQTLNLEHNQVHLLKKEDLRHCSNLRWLNMASNRLKLQGEPFSEIQNLKFLDVSMNKLLSAKLGSQPQLPSLVNLSMGLNDFNTLKSDDFSFLRLSHSLQVLNLSSVSLKTMEPGCFKPISGIRTLILDGSKMVTQLILKLCSELSGTAINALSLKKMKLITLNNRTFTGLQQTNLTFLDLSGNGMAKIERGTFQWLSSLQSLILSDNNLKHLTKETFLGLKMLKELQLTRALVKSRSSPLPIIDDFSFQTLINLKSLILCNTTISEITEHTFTGLTSLTELDLSRCSYIHTPQREITNMTFISLAKSPLRKLNLARNTLAKINPGSFSVLRNLTTLNLDYNFLKQTLTGSELEGLDQLQELHITNNYQSIDLTSGSFTSVSSLTVLTLGKSLKAEALKQDPSPFWPLSSLTVLDLSNNNIANIRENTLGGLVNLRVLKLQHNNFARLWKMANLGGPVLFLKDTQQLVTLQMDNNGLDEIPKDAFKGLNDLRELSLSNNLLNSLRYSVFDDLKSLKVLRLEKNLITTVRPEVFKTPMSNLSVFIMDKNPFDCTCESILWFVTWLNSTNMTKVPGLRDHYTCNTPPAYFNRSIMDFDQLSCKDMTPFQALFILSSTAVLMLMSSALLVRFHGWRFHFYWNVLINRTLGFSDTKGEEIKDYEYDAYIIHAEKDANWVNTQIVPLENEKCLFCLEDRDSVIGMSQLESIVNNMRTSRKILFVVTESLLNDPWCRRFKVYQALHQVIEDSRDSVVLVFLQDVHDYKLSRSLFLRRGMLRPRCILTGLYRGKKSQPFTRNSSSRSA
ncbi:LOW QUALITY PROTEIN: toll-like receptor 3 [Cololabis saira]|uniref:LOW QUALITY PROTEIN: toll-like receptor 3 n=1 Tax=Cololabis saira TaxID=129043 RepID=UPI002AD484A4|nr:LOW QUALITY PROTEIN: toll-like receptor 3 [Cololabis saira]